MDFAKYLPDAARMAFVPAAALHSQLAGVGTTAMYGGAGRAGTGPECAVPLDRAMTALLWRLFGDSAALRMSLRESQSRLFDKPFQVVLGGRHAHFPLTARMRERVIETHWMPVLRELDTRLRVFGVAPWYFEPLKLRGAGGGSSDDGAVPRRAHLAPGARRARRRNPAPWQDAREADAYIGGGGGDASSSCSADGGGDDSSSASDDDELEEEDGDGALDLWVPRVPPLGTGDVETYVLDGRQHLQWRWNAAANWRGRKTDQVDAGVHVEVESMPDIGGRYTSDFAALVRDHLLVRDLGRLLCAAGENAVHPLHVIEFHPNIADATGTRGAATYRDTSSVQPYFATGQTLFPGEPGRAFDTRTPLERVQQLHAEQLREDGRHGGAAPLAEHAYMPPGYAPAGGGAAPFAVEAALAAKRDVFLANHPEAAALFPNLGAAGRARPANTLELQPYEHFVAAPVHAPDTAALLPLINRLDQLVASLGDYPLEMIMGMGGRGGGSAGGAGKGGGGGARDESGMQQFITSRLRTRSNLFAAIVRAAFVRAHAATLQRAHRASRKLFRRRHGRAPAPSERDELRANLDIQIIFPRTPLLSFDQMATYFQHRMITEDDFYAFAVDIVGLGDKAAPAEMRKALALLYPVDDVPPEAAPAPVPAGPGTAGAGKRGRPAAAEGAGPAKKKAKTKD